MVRLFSLRTSIQMSAFVPCFTSAISSGVSTAAISRDYSDMRIGSAPVTNNG